MRNLNCLCTGLIGYSDEKLLNIDDIIAPTEQERQKRVHNATGGPGGIPRWARILKEREERNGAKVNVEDGNLILI